MSDDLISYSFRMDRKIRDEAVELYDELGITLAGAINLFIRQSIRERGIPFAITLNTDFAREQKSTEKRSDTK